MEQEKKKQLPSSEEFIPHLAYDSVIFGFNGEKLKILLLEYHNTHLFALPGGFVKINENLNVAVKRGLKERTGLDKIYLEQFHTFGSTSRTNADVMRTILEANDYEVENDHWMLDRFLSVAYYALINYNDVDPRPDELSDSISWYALEELPPLMMDHREIVSKALQTLKDNLEKKLVGMNLLPERFTMKELQRVYEAVLGEKLVVVVELESSKVEKLKVPKQKVEKKAIQKAPVREEKDSKPSNSQKENTQPSTQNSKLKTLTVYTVKSGDNLWAIAKKYSGVSAKNIMDFNGINGELTVGQKINIPKYD